MDLTREYARALEARNVDHLLAGSKSFHHREEVETIRAALTAIEWPDDELSVFATLKGSLFTIADENLLVYKHKNGPTAPVPTEGGRISNYRGRWNCWRSFIACETVVHLRRR